MYAGSYLDNRVAGADQFVVEGDRRDDRMCRAGEYRHSRAVFERTADPPSTVVLDDTIDDEIVARERTWHRERM